MIPVIGEGLALRPRAKLMNYYGDNGIPLRLAASRLSLHSFPTIGSYGCNGIILRLAASWLHCISLFTFHILRLAASWLYIERVVNLDTWRIHCSHCCILFDAQCRVGAHRCGQEQLPHVMPL